MRGRLSICVLVGAACVLVGAAALFGADRFTWDWHKVERPKDTLSQTQLSDSDRAALKAALSTELGPPLPSLSTEEQDPDVRIRLLDLNGDHIPEVIAQATNRFWCGATGNCSLWIFRKSGKTYESILGTEDVNSFLGFTVTQHRSGGYLDLIINQHESATRQALLVFKFRDRKYRASDCREANWESAGDEPTIEKEPRITPCR